jgi:hypothetical protein
MASAAATGDCGGEFGTDTGQVVGNDAPADPFIKASIAMVKATVELMLAFEDADAAFDAGMEAATAFEPRLLFKAAAGVLFTPRFG